MATSPSSSTSTIPASPTSSATAPATTTGVSSALPPQPIANTADTQVRWKGFAAGVASGATKLLVGHPFDTIKTRMQCSPPGTFTGPLDCLKRTIKLEGPRALYKGASPPAVGWAMSDAVLLGSLHNYRLMFARLEARQRGEDVGDEAAARLSLKGHTASGILAGMSASCVICPVEHIKAKLQMQMTGPKLYKNPIDCVAQVYRANGPTGLYRGFFATLLFRSWFGAYFCSYEIMMRRFRAVPEESKWKVSSGTATFLSGGMASNAFWIGSFPFDTIKNRMMTDSPTNPKYKGIKDVALKVWAEGGPKAFYRGFVPCLLRAFPTNASALLVWETTMQFLGAEQLKT
ncbi:mitochondrial carrier domain-containing protein [Leucosporidium creatinivorum]|uniref:Mitochondrial carrier domain-containing protein n=1 Tax=Leucosporidium creatinivorum TaxID=106004 RepID=A0A1Y2G102_9BASI|nr:mitochondrial carrier domain-containing protein [Leucosporidium creatinivorum]